MHRQQSIHISTSNPHFFHSGITCNFLVNRKEQKLLKNWDYDADLSFEGHCVPETWFLSSSIQKIHYNKVSDNN